MHTLRTHGQSLLADFHSTSFAGLYSEWLLPEVPKSQSRGLQETAPMALR